MKYSLTHLSDSALAHDMTALVARERTTMAALLAHLAEFDVRRLYLAAAHPSMYSYCVHELGLSEDAAFKRIHAARAARQHPAIFAALAAGRLHLSAVILLAPHLTPENRDELLAAAAGRSKSEIEQLLAERFPRPDVPARVQALSAPPGQVIDQLSPGIVELLPDQHAPGRVQASDERLAPGPVERSADRPRLAPLAPQRFALQLTMSQQLHDKLRYAQELLSHQVAAGDVAQVLERALDALIVQLEKRKFAATRRQHRPGATQSGRYVPAHVKRAVWERDGGRCTFVSESGRRCPARLLLEFDHLHEVARGGLATIEGMRLRCRAHNQYGAERTFGVEFMHHKRAEARSIAATRARTVGAQQAEARNAAAAGARTVGAQRAEARNAAAAACARTVAAQQAEEVIPWLRALGFRTDEARRAAALCEAIPNAPIEERVRMALSYFRPRSASRLRVEPASAGCGP